MNEFSKLLVIINEMIKNNNHFSISLKQKTNENLNHFSVKHFSSEFLISLNKIITLKEIKEIYEIEYCLNFFHD